MDLSARLHEQLSLLALGAVRDGTDLVQDLTTLVGTLSTAVSGYAGLRLTLVHGGHPVRLTALLPVQPGHEVVTSLRLALRPVSGSLEEGGRLVVWSTVPGALVDLAADLGHAVGASRPSRTPAVALDADLPLPSTASGVEGLDELTTVQRAAGLLIARGHDPAAVDSTLRDAARAHGTSTYAWAVRLLEQR